MPWLNFTETNPWACWMLIPYCQWGFFITKGCVGPLLRAQWIRLRLPSCGPRFESRSSTSPWFVCFTLRGEGKKLTHWFISLVWVNWFLDWKTIGGIQNGLAKTDQWLAWFICLILGLFKPQFFETNACIQYKDSNSRPLNHRSLLIGNLYIRISVGFESVFIFH